MVTPSLVRLSNIAAGYDANIVVNNVSLDIGAKDIVAFIGPNGGGKTTIIKVILGQLQPTNGCIEKMPGLRIGYLPQIHDIDINFPITVANVVLSGQQNGCRLRPTFADKAQMKELLRFAQLDHLANRPIGELSGGQRQRAFLCRAIMGNPHLLILDEPITYMDKTAETNLYKLLPELSKKMAIVLVSHDIGTISPLVKTIACINGTLHYHDSNKISSEILAAYECPVEIISHGKIPHRVLSNHQ